MLKTLFDSLINPKSSRAENWLMLCLCILVFAVSFVTGDYSRVNAVFISIIELIFLCLYLVLLRDVPPVVQIVRRYPVTSLLFILWFVSISFSFLDSPLGLIEKKYAWERYIQTILHTIVFIFLWDFFSRHKPPSKYLFYLIPLSTLVIIIIFVVDLLFLLNLFDNALLAEQWFQNPPFNSHIRHTGYQAAAALCIFFVYFVDKQMSARNEALSFFVLATLWSFLFWLGGRGAILSVFGTLLFLWSISHASNRFSRNFIYFVLVAALIGLFVGEWLAVFDWNGVTNTVQRSLNTDDVDGLFSGRISIWMSVWKSVRDYIAFGLGSQGYYFMPNRIYGVQPHNLIMQFLIEWGLVGTLLFISLLLRGFWVGFKVHVLGRQKGVSMAALAAGSIICILSIHALTDGTYYHPQPAFYLVLAFSTWVIPYETLDQKFHKNEGV